MPSQVSRVDGVEHAIVSLLFTELLPLMYAKRRCHEAKGFWGALDFHLLKHEIIMFLKKTVVL